MLKHAISQTTKEVTYRMKYIYDDNDGKNGNCDGTFMKILIMMMKPVT